MTKILTIVFCIAVLLSQGQGKPKTKDIEISFDRVVILHFESNVHKAWVGNDKMAKPTLDADKVILQSKKENDEFIENNLMVQTVDGAFYTFTLKFNNTPAQEFYPFTPNDAIYKGKPLNSDDSVLTKKTGQSIIARDAQDKKEIDIKAACREVEARETIPTGLAQEKSKMQFFVGGIFVKENRLFFKILIANKSNIPYDIDFIRFVAEAESKKVKRTASQADAKTALYILGDEKKHVIKEEILTLVFAFEKFTIDKKEKLYIEFWEHNGDRNIRLGIPSKAILDAKAL